MLDNFKGKEQNVEKFRQKCGSRLVFGPGPFNTTYVQKLKFCCGFFQVMCKKPKTDVRSRCVWCGLAVVLWCCEGSRPQSEMKEDSQGRERNWRQERNVEKLG